MAWERPGPYEGLDMGALGLDEAYLQVLYDGQSSARMYEVSSNCHECPWQRMDSPVVSPNTTFTMHTHHPVSLLVTKVDLGKYLRTGGPEEAEALCHLGPTTLGEFGVYQLDLRGNQNGCELITALEPVNANLALLVWFLVAVGAVLLWWGLKRVPGDPVGRLGGLLGWSKPAEEEKSGKIRLRSLDTFRGIAIALMMFVNDGGGGYWFMEHSTWNGLYVADLVFPWFLWIMGVCIPMSVKSNLKKETPTRSVVWAITVRSVKLFLLGFILNSSGWITLSKLRVPGVLQRFGICYFVVSLVGFCFSRANPPKLERGSWIADLVHLWPQWLVMLVILAAHQAVVYLVPAPGCEAGYAGPGGLHQWTPERNNTGCIGGITGYIDKAFFSTPHIYGNPTAKSVYSASAFDPEGLFGSLPSMFQVFLGYQAGYILQVYPGHRDRLTRWLAWSLLTGSLGALLSGGSQEGGWVPVNKNLWSISFVLVTSCFAFALLAALYVLIDLKHWWKGQPFFYAGMNSILLYCGHQIGWMITPFHWALDRMDTHAARLPEAMWGVALWLIISFVLYRKKIFITV